MKLQKPQILTGLADIEQGRASAAFRSDCVVEPHYVGVRLGGKPDALKRVPTKGAALILAHLFCRRASEARR